MTYWNGRATLKDVPEQISKLRDVNVLSLIILYNCHYIKKNYLIFQWVIMMSFNSYSSRLEKVLSSHYRYQRKCLLFSWNLPILRGLRLIWLMYWFTEIPGKHWARYWSTNMTLPRHLWNLNDDEIVLNWRQCDASVLTGKPKLT